MTNSKNKRVILSTSERKAPQSASLSGPADPNKIISVSVLVRRKTSLPPADGIRRLSREDFETTHGADAAHFELIRQFAQQHNLAVDETGTSVARRTITLHGTVKAMQDAFGVNLQQYSGAAGRAFHDYVGSVSVPENLAPVIEGVFGLSNRPVASPNVHIREDEDLGGSNSYYANIVSDFYSFPNGTGTGQTAGILEFGGGYTPSDLSTYFGLAGVPEPSVVAVSVAGGINNPGKDTNADAEVALDIEVIGTVAPGAKIAVYFAPNSEQGFIEALTTAVQDTVNKPSVISVSWGGSETGWSQAVMNSFDQECQAAALLGITVAVASGDRGASNGESTNTVQFPACAPHVLACGGTRIGVSADSITAEKVWNDGADSATGGGISRVFSVPSYQNGCEDTPVGDGPVELTGRGVPDVSGNASPGSGYNVYYQGGSHVVGGTSAVAPLWAALISICNSLKGSNVGFINAALYANSSLAFRDIVDGNNSGRIPGYQASAGWDACTGLGSPYGIGIASVLGVSGNTSDYKTVRQLQLYNDGGFVTDIHALYKSPTAIAWKEASNNDNFPIGQTRTMKLSEKCDSIQNGWFVKMKVFVVWGDDNTDVGTFVYNSSGPTQNFKISGAVWDNSLQYTGTGPGVQATEPDLIQKADAV